MIINILVDNPKTWIVPYARLLSKKLIFLGHKVNFAADQKKIIKGDCAFFLGCQKIVNKRALSKNKHNLVVHESYLPKGKGWSPLTWQILGGKNDIPITLFEASGKVDGGEIYLQEIMHFRGDELNDELKKEQGEKTIELAEKFIKLYGRLKGKKQQGKATFYRRRTPADSKLDMKKSLAEQFNLLRVADNERYPAFFIHKNKKYILKIFNGD